MEDAEKTLLDLLKSEWNASNTYDLKPTITFGWFDEDNLPMVTIQQPSDNPTGGGETGFSGFNSDGPTQRFTGTIPVNVWATRPAIQSASATTQNARQYNSAVAEECRRIVKENASSPINPITAASDLNYISWLGKTPLPEADRPTTLFRFECLVGFGYDDL